MWVTAKYNGISARWNLDQVKAAAIFDIESNADKKIATHKGRTLSLSNGIFSKVRNFFKFESQKNRSRKDAQVALRVEKAAGNRENPVAKVDADIPDPVVQARIEAAANVKLVFDTTVMVINVRLDNIEASINALLVQWIVKAKPALMATAINDLRGAQAFMKNQAEFFMQIANARGAISEFMGNDGASADLWNVSGQCGANAVVKLDKSAMCSMLNSIRADMRDVLIAEEKAKPKDKKLYIPLAEGLLARLNKTQASMKAVVEAEGASWDEWLAGDIRQFDMNAWAVAGDTSRYEMPPPSPAQQTPMPANGLDPEIYFYKPDADFSAPGFVTDNAEFPAEDAKTFSTFKPASKAKTDS